MANYSDIKGFTVQTLSTDTVANAAAGGSWASGGTINNTRDMLGGAGPQTSALIFGGNPYPGSSAYTESYDGSSWTEVADLNTARILLGGLGTSNTAVIAFGGNLSPPNYRAETESWNGSAWTEVNDLNDGRWAMAGNAGTQTAGLLFGGAPGEVPSSDAHTESWNGTSWSNEPDMNTARSENAGAGTSTNALSIGGTPSYPTATAVVEQWNGSSWTEITDINTARNDLGGLKGGGTITDALVFGGLNRSGPTTYASTEFWDGSSWTELADLSTARYGGSGSGTSSAALYAAGNTGSRVGISEEWSAPSDFNQIQEGQLYFNSTANAFKETVTDLPGGSWASGASINDGRNASGSAGTTTAALLFTGDPVSGSPTGISANTEKYDGSSWTEVNNTNTARRECFYGCGLTNTAALCVGGYDGSAKTSNVETWDGTNWTETTNLNQTRNSGALVGSSTAAIGFGGIEPPFTGKTEFWNGSTWTELADLNTSRYVISGAGPSYTAALAFGGYSTSYDAETEEWNGTSWTEVSDLNTARYGIGATVSSSSLNSILAFGGDEAPPANNKTEFWNGSSWSELAEISTARFQGGSTGTSGTGALFFGGAPNPVATSTEEWTVNLANKTITAS